MGGARRLSAGRTRLIRGRNSLRSAAASVFVYDVRFLAMQTWMASQRYHHALFDAFRVLG